MLRRSGEFKHATLLIQEEASELQLNVEFLCEVLRICASKCDVEEEIVCGDPKKYLKDLSWSLQMYMKGSCPDFRFICSRSRTNIEVLVEHLQSCMHVGKKRYEKYCIVEFASK